MVNKIVLFFLMFSFLIGYSQIPKINKSFSINKYINSFIKVNNNSNFKPNKSLIHLFAHSKKEKKQYIIFISRDNIESTLIKENSDYLEFYKYRNFDLLLQGKTLEDIYFLKKIIKGIVVSKNSKVRFKKSYKNVSNDPYQWFLFFDFKMNLIDYTITDNNKEAIDFLEKNKY